MDKVASISMSYENYLGFLYLLEKWHPFLEFTTNDHNTKKFLVNQRYYAILTYL